MKTGNRITVEEDISWTECVYAQCSSERKLNTIEKIIDHNLPTYLKNIKVIKMNCKLFEQLNYIYNMYHHEIGKGTSDRS